MKKIAERFRKKKKYEKPHARRPVYAAPNLVKAVFTVKELRNATLFTILILFIYRIGCSIPTPGTTAAQLLEALSDNSTLLLMNLIGGGSLSNFSLFTMGVGPYITASIIIQMLSMDVIPALTELSKSGQKGQIKINRITKYLGFVLAIVQSWALVRNLDQQYGLLVVSDWRYYCMVIAVQVGGYAATIWLADQITRHGIGNGLSMMIFFGIIVSVPNMILSAYSSFLGDVTGNDIWLGVAKFVGFLLVYLLIIIGVIFIETSTRRIRIRYANQSYMTSDPNSYLPIKVNPASVIPVIFAQSIINVAQIIGSLISSSAYQSVQSFFSLNTYHGMAIYIVLIVFFGYMYTEIELDPEQIAEQFNKNGAYIPNIRPGKDTARYIHKTSFRVASVGIIALALMAILPYLLSRLTNLDIASSIGGTGIIVAVGVAIEMMAGLRAAATPSQKLKLW